MADYLIIGLSNFATVLSKTLYSLGENVMVIDEDKEQIQKIRDSVSQAITADATDRSILEKIVSDPNITAVISLGSSLEKNVMVTYHLKQLGVKRVIAKANSDDQGKVLTLVGANDIVYPERDMAVELAEKLHNPTILNRLSLGENYSIVEINIPSKFLTKSLADLRLRNLYKINVLAIKNVPSKQWLVNPDASYILKEFDTLVVLGHVDDLNNLARDANKN